MSVYTAVTPEELRAWLGQYSLGSLVELKGIAAGVENTNYFVTTTHGRYVLTLFERMAPESLPYYLNLMAHLASHGIPCPQPIASLDNRYVNPLKGKPACIVTRLNGAPQMQPTATHCAEVGEMLADLHLAARSYPAELANPRGPHWWRETARLVMPHLDAPGQALLMEELRFQALYRFEDLPRGVIHADLFRDNVLFEDSRLSGVIDFYFACNDVWLFDLAIAVNDWCLAEDLTLDAPRVMAMLTAYHGRRPLTAIEKGAWPVMLRAAALRFWLSRLYDYHFPRPGEVTHAKDPEHFQRVLENHIHHEPELRRHWVS
jgi:homoserine kinase type II